MIMRALKNLKNSAFALKRLALKAGVLVLASILHRTLISSAQLKGLTFLNKQALPFILSTLLPTLLLSSPATHAEQQALTNALKNHPSPYLAMHGNDPIHWQDWSPSVLQSAIKSNKPIIVSSGYFACHWCHVMQQESYLNSTVAKPMNQNFISVKLDRELHPDLDQYLIEFSRSLTGRAGWPQHVVLTPQGYPFAAFGYLPTANFIATLDNIKNAWQQQPKKIIELAEQAPTNKPSAVKSNEPTDPLSSAEFKTLLLDELANQVDDLSGGLKGSNKFPESPLLLSLLEIEYLSENKQDWLELTLEQMQSQHLIDHIHGGFYRYTIDPEWQTPHFEKMGYDNALLAQLYFKAGQKFKRNDFIETGKQTLRYMEKHLYHSKIALFASSQSALDAAGVEGGAYLFSKSQLKKRLSKRAFEHITKAWQLNNPPPYEEGWHPLSTTQYWREIKSALQTPVKEIPKDRKHILSWNGLALSAYAAAYQATNEIAYLNKASALAKRLSAIMEQPNAPRAVDNLGIPIGVATLEDYAYTIRGLESLNSALAPNSKTAQNRTITDRTKRTLKRLYQITQKTFLNASGWRTNQTFLLPTQNRQAALMDDAIPSASAILECAANNSTLNRSHRFSEQLRQKPLSYSSYLQALQCKENRPLSD